MEESIGKIKALLSRRVDEEGIFPSRENAEKRLSGERLKFYYGIDPTGPYIHLGHTVQLWLLRELAELGHEIVVLIGDFTAKIGDPTGKDATRRPLSDEEIKKNEKDYLEQLCKIIPKGSFTVDHNSRWLKDMNFEKIIELASNLTVHQMIARDMFWERWQNNKPISIHEFMYPLMQGYDSVAMKVDGEIGGHDQIFNMLVGRDLEKKYLNKDKIVLATKLLVDKTSGKKMSKSEGEIIALKDEPSEIRRKVLALDDSMTKTIFELCTGESQEWIEEKFKKLSAREYKEVLGDKLVELYHGKDKVKEAHQPVPSPAPSDDENLAETIKKLGFTSSVSESKRLITDGAVQVNDEVEKNWKRVLQTGDRIKVGKGKFAIIK